MKLVTFIVFLAFSAVNSSADEIVSEFVVNGEDASIRDFPHLAKIWTVNFPTCGGAILNSRNVLTAAHCLLSRISQPFVVSVVVGSSYRNGQGGRRHYALRIFMHPDYIPGPNVYDVAIVRTLSRITFNELSQPIPLSSVPDIGVDVQGSFAGWGFVGYGGILPRVATILQKMPYRTISNDQCQEMYSVTHRGQFVVDQKICILSGPRQSVCGGDSGTPLVVNGEVAGVLSWRTNPCGDGLPDVFIRISAVRTWILSIV